MIFSNLFIMMIVVMLSIYATVVSAADITGHVIDAISGAPVCNASIILTPGNSLQKTDSRGEFIFRQTGYGEYSLHIIAIGYADGNIERITVRYKDPSVYSYKIPLKPLSFNTEITVLAKPIEVRFKDVMQTEIPVELIESEPGALEDPIKKVLTLPGVTSDSDFMSILYVRGGSSDETLLILDRTYLLNPYHLGGAFSVYSEDLLEKVDFYTGGFPARFGNALSGVLDVSYRDGDFHQHHLMADVSMISAKFLIEGPIQRDNTSFILSARRSYWDYALDLFGVDDAVVPYWGDLFAKITSLMPTRRIGLEGLVGQDGIERFLLEEPLENPDAALSTFYYLNRSRFFNLTWEEWFDPQWSFLGVFSYSTTGTLADLTGTEPLFADAIVDFITGELQIDRSGELFRFSGGIQAGKADFTLDSFLTDFRSSIPGSRKTGNENVNKTDIDFEDIIQFQSIWSEVAWTPDWNRLFQLTWGNRFDRWHKTSEVTYSPRLDTILGITDRFRIKCATGVFRQFPYNVLQTAPGFGNPELNSERAVHIILGCESDISQFLKVRIESFYKWYDRQIVNHDTEEAAIAAALNGRAFINEGTGMAYGGDLFLQVFPWKFLDGWLTYTYTLTRLHNPLNSVNPTEYYPLQDQKHTVHLVTNIRAFKQFTFSTRLSFNTGRPTTNVVDWELQLDNDPPHFPIWVAEYGALNSSRLPNYLRLDVRGEWIQQTQHGIWSVSCELLNVTDQENLYEYAYDSGEPPDRKPEIEHINNLPFIPVLGVSFRF